MTPAGIRDHLPAAGKNAPHPHLKDEPNVFATVLTVAKSPVRLYTPLLKEPIVTPVALTIDRQ
jgi:hypothetical protein